MRRVPSAHRAVRLLTAAALCLSSISPALAGPLNLPAYAPAGEKWNKALGQTGLPAPSRRGHDPLVSKLRGLGVTPKAWTAADPDQRQAWLEQASAAVAPELEAAARTALERLSKASIVDAAPRDELAEDLSYLRDAVLPYVSAKTASKLRQASAAVAERRVKRLVGKHIKPSPDPVEAAFRELAAPPPAPPPAAFAAAKGLGSLTPGRVSGRALDAGELAAAPDAEGPEMEKGRQTLRPLVRWIGDFHVTMRADFPRADFSMRDADAFFKYLRVMRHHPRDRADPKDPRKTVSGRPTLAELVEGAAHYIYGDRLGLSHPEDYQKRQADRQRFEQKLTDRLKKLPGSLSDLDVIPRAPAISYPKPFPELQAEYFEIFPELAAKGYAVKRSKPAKLVRDPQNLPTVEQRIEDVVAAVSTRDPLLLLGDSAVAKSFMIRAYYDTILNPAREAAGKAVVPVISVGVKPNMGSRELIGRYAPRPVVQDGRATEYAAEFAFLAGSLVRAMVLGQALILEEITNAQPEFLEVINFYLTHGRLIIHQKGGKPLTVHPHPDFRLFATGNWTHFTGRNAQSQAFWSRWRVKIWEAYPIDETGFIIGAKYRIEQYLASQLAVFQEALNTQLRARKIGKHLHGQHALNLRTLERVAARYADAVKRLEAKGRVSEEDKLRVLGKVMFMVYGSMLEGASDKRALLDLMNESVVMLRGTTKILFSDRGSKPQNLGGKYVALGVEPDDLEPEVTGLRDAGDALIVTEKTLGEFRFPKGPGGENVPGPSARLTLVPEVTQQLFRLLLAWHYREPYLMLGERAAGKTRTAYFAAHLLDMPVLYIAHSQESNLKEVIGGYYPRADAEGLVKKTGELPPLVWLDGKEIQAMEWGKGKVPDHQVGAWLFEDDVNLSTMHEMRNTVTDDGIQTTPYRQVAAGPNFWSVQAGNPPDVMRYQGRKQLSPAHLSRRQVSWQTELDRPVKNGSGDPKASDALVEITLDRLLGAPRAKKPLALAAAPGGGADVRGQRPLSAPEKARIEEALAVMRRVPSWRKLERLLRSNPIPIDSAALTDRTYGVFQPGRILLNRRMLAEASPEFLALVIAKEASHYQESLVHQKYLGAFRWLQEGEKMELFRSLAGWHELGAPSQKDYDGFLHGPQGIYEPWLADADSVERSMMLDYLEMAETAGLELLDVDGLARQMALRFAQGMDERGFSAERLLAVGEKFNRNFRALLRYYKKNWIDARDRWRQRHLGERPDRGLARAQSPPAAGEAPPAAPSGNTILGLAAARPSPYRKDVEDLLSLFPELPAQARKDAEKRLLALPKADRDALSKAVSLRERLAILATSISQRSGIKVRFSLAPLKMESGEFPYYYNRQTDSVVLYIDAVIDLLKKPNGELVLFGILDHEAGHGMASRLSAPEQPGADPLADFFFATESHRLLLNAVEDPRMENWVVRLFPGAEPELDALNEDIASGKSDRPELERMPHLQYALGTIHYAKTGKIARFAADKQAREALEKSRPYLDRIFQTLPPGHTFDPVKHEQAARRAAELARDHLWPLYEPLVAKSKQNAQNGGQSQGQGRLGKARQRQKGQKERKQGGGHAAGSAGSGEDAVEKASKSLADKLAGGKQRAERGEPQGGSSELESGDLASAEPSGENRSGKPGKSAKADTDGAQGKAKDPSSPDAGRSPAAAQAARQLLEDIEESLHAYFDSTLSAYEDRLARMHEAIDRLTGLLANIFYKNAEPELRGHFEDGDEPDMDRLMDIIGSREIDLSFWQRFVEHTKRRFKVMLILDLSGSMKGGAAEEGLLDTVALLLNACQRLGIDVNVMGFDNRVFPDLKPFGLVLDNDGMLKLEKKIVATGSGTTSDGDALYEGLEQMKQEDAERKIVIVVTDGDGNSGKHKAPDLIKDAQDHNIEVVGVGVAGGAEYVRKTYRKTAYVIAPSAEALPEPLAELLVRNIWAAFDADVDTRLHIELGDEAYGRAFDPGRAGPGKVSALGPSIKAGAAALDVVARSVEVVGEGAREKLRALGVADVIAQDGGALFFAKSAGALDEKTLKALVALASDPGIERLVLSNAYAAQLRSVLRGQARARLVATPGRSKGEPSGSKPSDLPVDDDHLTLRSFGRAFNPRFSGAPAAAAAKLKAWTSDELREDRTRGWMWIVAPWDKARAYAQRVGWGRPRLHELGGVRVRVSADNAVMQAAALEMLSDPQVHEVRAEAPVVAALKRRLARRAGRSAPADSRASDLPVDDSYVSLAARGASALGGAFDPRRTGPRINPRPVEEERSEDSFVGPAAFDAASKTLFTVQGSGHVAVRRLSGALRDRPDQRIRHGDWIADMVFLAGPRLLATMSLDSIETRRVSADGRVEERTLQRVTLRRDRAGPPSALAADPAGGRLFVGLQKGGVSVVALARPDGRAARLLDRARALLPGFAARRLRLTGRAGPVQDAFLGGQPKRLAFEPDGSLLMAQSSEGLAVLRVEPDGRLAKTATFLGPEDAADLFAYDPRSKTALTSGWTGPVTARRLGRDGTLSGPLERFEPGMKGKPGPPTGISLDPQAGLLAAWGHLWAEVRRIGPDGAVSRPLLNLVPQKDGSVGEIKGAAFETGNVLFLRAMSAAIDPFDPFPPPGNVPVLQRFEVPPESKAFALDPPAPAAPVSRFSDLPVDDEAYGRAFDPREARRQEELTPAQDFPIHVLHRMRVPFSKKGLEIIGGERVVAAVLDPLSRTLYTVGEQGSIEARPLGEDGKVSQRPTLKIAARREGAKVRSAGLDLEARILWISYEWGSAEAWPLEADGRLAAKPRKAHRVPTPRRRAGQIKLPGKTETVFSAVDLRAALLLSLQADRKPFVRDADDKTLSDWIDVRRLERDGAPHPEPLLRVKAPLERFVDALVFDSKTGSLFLVSRSATTAQRTSSELRRYVLPLTAASGSGEPRLDAVPAPAPIPAGRPSDLPVGELDAGQDDFRALAAGLPAPGAAALAASFAPRRDKSPLALKPVSSRATAGPAHQLAFDPFSRTVFAFGEGTLESRPLTDSSIADAPRQSLPVHNGERVDFAWFDEASRTLISVSKSSFELRRVDLKGRLERAFRAVASANGAYLGAAFEPASRTLAAARSDGLIEVWKLDAAGAPGAEPEQTLKADGEPTGHLAFDPVSGSLVSGHERLTRRWAAMKGRFAKAETVPVEFGERVNDSVFDGRSRSWISVGPRGDVRRRFYASDGALEKDPAQTLTALDADAVFKVLIDERSRTLLLFGSSGGIERRPLGDDGWIGPPVQRIERTGGTFADARLDPAGGLLFTSELDGTLAARLLPAYAPPAPADTAAVPEPAAPVSRPSDLPVDDPFH